MRAPLKFELDRRQGVLNIGYGAGSSPTFTNLTVTGVALFADGTAAAPSISFAADSDTGFYRPTANQIGLAVAGVSQLFFLSNGRIFGQDQANSLQLASTGFIALTASGTNQNITLTPSGTGYLSVANGNAGAGYAAIIKGSATYGLGVYMGNGGTDVSLWSVTNSPLIFGTNEAERMRLFANGRLGIGTGATDSGALLQIGTNTTTSAGGMVFGTDLFLYRNGANLFLDQSGTTSQYIVSISGVAKAGFGVSSGSTYLDGIGSLILRSNGTTTALTLDASQNATFAGSVTAAAAANFTFSGRSYISSPADGIIRLLNNAGTDFTRLQFGGTTASFPSLGRSGTQIEVLLADGSAYAKIAAGSVSLRTAAANGGAGEVVVGSTTQTTVGAAGGASALPATPSGFLKFKIGTVDYVFPYYAA